MDTEELVVETGGRPAAVDISNGLARFASGRGDGLLSVFVPHATAGVAILEVGAGSDQDLLTAIDELLPAERGRWHHEHGSPGPGRDHGLAACVSRRVSNPRR